jgi:hypothetical protein
MERTPDAVPRASVVPLREKMRAPSPSAVSLALHWLRGSNRATIWRGSYARRWAAEERG